MRCHYCGAVDSRVVDTSSDSICREIHIDQLLADPMRHKNGLYQASLEY